VTYNLDTLKQELLDHIAAEEFGVFKGQAGGNEGFPKIYWDTERYPEYQAYLNVAKSAGVSVIIFAHREFEAGEIDDALEQIEDCEFGRDERRSIESSLADLRTYVGSTCIIEMAFSYQGHMYVYELMTEWFQTFMDMSDLLVAASSANGDDDGEDESDSSFGGYYSKN
jgi:hypothetical protein